MDCHLGKYSSKIIATFVTSLVGFLSKQLYTFVAYEGYMHGSSVAFTVTNRKKSINQARATLYYEAKQYNARKKKEIAQFLTISYHKAVLI